MGKTGKQRKKRIRQQQQRKLGNGTVSDVSSSKRRREGTDSDAGISQNDGLSHCDLLVTARTLSALSTPAYGSFVSTSAQDGQGTDDDQEALSDYFAGTALKQLRASLHSFYQSATWQRHLSGAGKVHGFSLSIATQVVSARTLTTANYSVLEW